jgi:hypothetical protein
MPGDERELARIVLAIGDEIGDRLDRRIGTHRDAERVAGQARDVREVLQRVELHLLHVRQPLHADGGLRQRVAVGLRRNEFVRPQHAARARLVVDDHLPAEALARALGERAHHRVGGAAGGPRTDQADRLGRIGLAACDTGKHDRHGRRNGTQQQPPADRGLGCHGRLLVVGGI